jgi:hypothetical protein
VADGQSLGVLDEHHPYPNLPLEPEQAEALLYWLIPAVIECTDALGGELDAQDLIQLTDGRVLLSPSGIIRDRSLARLPFHLAPEADPEAVHPTAAAALYGLGVLFFKAITGELPVQARTMDQLRAGQVRPRTLHEFRPELSQELNTLLAGLLHHQPGFRLATVDGLPQLEDSPKLSRVHRQELVESGSRQQVDRGISRTSMVIKKWTLLLKPPPPNRAALRRISGCRDLFSNRVLESLEAGLPVALGSFATESEALSLEDQLGEADASLEVVFTGHKSGKSWMLAGCTLGGLGSVGAIASGLAIGGPVGIALGVFMLGGGYSGLSLWGHSRQVKAIQAGIRLGHGRVKLPEELAAVRDTLGEARRAVHNQDLPEVIEVELGASLDALQDELEDLSRLQPDELKREPARGRLDQVDVAARRIRDAAKTTSSGSGQEASDLAHQRAQAAEAALKD